MAEIDWTATFAALGPVGGTLLVVFLFLHKTGFLKGEDPSRVDLDHKLDHAIRQLDAIDTKTDRIDREQTDRLARIETMQAEMARRISRLEG